MPRDPQPVGPGAVLAGLVHQGLSDIEEDRLQPHRYLLTLALPAPYADSVGLHCPIGQGRTHEKTENDSVSPWTGDGAGDRLDGYASRAWEPR
ncbi:hypothetical protein Mro03_48320 [Microbispora rosea subsp. rosea]|nr:hypothetical protein Mro03_48320 [Microbispora rosea subsp. rosea]